MSIAVADKRVDGDGTYEALHRVWTGHGLDDAGYPGQRRPTVLLVLHFGRNGRSLAKVLLVDPLYRPVG